MWIRVATKKGSVHLAQPIAYSYIEGEGTEEYYFGETVAEALEQDGFLEEMWRHFDAVFDWGDCDFFLPEKCKLLQEWLEQRLSKDTSKTLQPVYGAMLDFAKKASEYGTGMSFDF